MDEPDEDEDVQMDIDGVPFAAEKDFLEKCPKAFDDTSENYWKEKYLAEHREKEDYAKKVGQLAMQVDWLKKKSEEVLGPGYEDKFTPKPFEE